PHRPRGYPGGAAQPRDRAAARPGPGRRARGDRAARRPAVGLPPLSRRAGRASARSGPRPGSATRGRARPLARRQRRGTQVDRTTPDRVDASGIRDYSGVTYAPLRPPSTRNVEAVTYEDSSAARKRAAFASSEGSAKRPIGTWTSRRAAFSGSLA